MPSSVNSAATLARASAVNAPCGAWRNIFGTACLPDLSQVRTVADHSLDPQVNPGKIKLKIEAPGGLGSGRSGPSRAGRPQGGDNRRGLSYMGAMPRPYSARFSVAPMMDWTDRRCRAFHRILTRRARLYTEMVTADAVVFGPRERLIGFDAGEHPVALQLGGAEPGRLAEAARIGAEFGYDEINLNCGCPSDRVQSGRFGACLMREPERVAECMAAMVVAVDVPVTVKCRIGVDEQEPRASLFAFADAVKAAGAAALIVHARKAWLGGLSPKDNRSIPPLDHALVYALKRAHPDWPIILNGGLTDLDAARAHLSHVDGIMLGRAAYQNPELLLGIDPALFGEPAPVADSFEAIEAFMAVIARGLQRGERLHDYTRHLHGVFAGRPGARAYRRVLASQAIRPSAGLDVLREAVALVGRRAELTAAE
jgi:tRNA-dihydrouridine synthase A